MKPGKVLAGLHERRLKPEADNPREVAWFEAWKKEHACHDTMYQLMTVPCEKGTPGSWEAFGFIGGIYHRPLAETTDRDRQVASTVLQWLGSNCGMCVVSDALKGMGYCIAKEEDGKLRRVF